MNDSSQKEKKWSSASKRMSSRTARSFDGNPPWSSPSWFINQDQLRRYQQVYEAD